ACPGPPEATSPSAPIPPAPIPPAATCQPDTSPPEAPPVRPDATPQPIERHRTTRVKENDMPEWREDEGTIRLREPPVGGTPIVPEGAERADAYEGWARGQGVEDAPGFNLPLHEALASDDDMPVATIEDVEGLATGFKRDPERGLYIECRQVKAMLREAAQRL